MISFDIRDVADSFTEQMRIRGDLPPKSAIAALFTLMPTPTDLLATYSFNRGASAWQVFALDATGIAVTTASADEEWDWSAYRDPDSAVLRVTWHPFDDVQAVGITAVDRFGGSPADGGSVVARETWALTIAGREYVLDPREIAGGPPSEAGPFCRALIKARAR